MQQKQINKLAGERTRSKVGIGTNAMTQHIEVRPVTHGVAQFQMIDTDSKPSWKHFGGGSACIEVQAHPEAGWAQVTARETPESGRGVKEVHITLYRDAALELRDFLNETFGLI